MLPSTPVKYNNRPNNEDGDALHVYKNNIN